MLKWEHDHGHMPTTNAEKAEANREFAELYASLIRQRHEYNSIPVSTTEERQEITRPGGLLATTLEELGMRRPEDDFPVGMSPEGYSQDVMVPFLSGR